MPYPENIRKRKLQEIIAEDDTQSTGIPVIFKGEKKVLIHMGIPLDTLIYNKYNGRIGTLVKSHEKQHGSLDPENPDDVKTIEKIPLGIKN